MVFYRDAWEHDVTHKGVDRVHWIDVNNKVRVVTGAGKARRCSVSREEGEDGVGWYRGSGTTEAGHELGDAGGEEQRGRGNLWWRRREKAEGRGKRRKREKERRVNKYFFSKKFDRCSVLNDGSSKNEIDAKSE